MRPPERRLALAAAAGLGLVLVVVLAAAVLRIAGAHPLVRGLHRAAASLEVLVVAWLAWSAWRDRKARPADLPAVGVAVLLTVFLSILGIAAGQSPAPAQALGNVLGGLALAASFAWLLGRAGRDGARRAQVIPLSLAALLALQAVLGARLSIFGRMDFPALPAHAELGVVLVGLLGWFGLARIGGARGKLLFAVAAAALLAGFTALQYERSAAAALVHAAAAALLIATAACVFSRRA